VGDEVVETERSAPVRWDLPALLAAATGVALIVIGVLALVRSGIDGTWYQPVVEVAGISHTPLLGAIEIGVGVLLVLAAMAGVRVLAALVALAAGVAAVVVAIEPGAVERELAIETEWAVALAVGLLAVGLLILSLGREGERRERRVERRPVRRVRTG
jgi:peptidoglycan/LPS O-acetylase OafA/YrhL